MFTHKPSNIACTCKVGCVVYAVTQILIKETTGVSKTTRLFTVFVVCMDDNPTSNCVCIACMDQAQMNHVTSV